MHPHNQPSPPSFGSIAPTPPLYSPQQHAIAAFIGSFVAAGWLARANYLALGDPLRANRALGLGVLGTVVFMALALQLPPETPKFLFVVVPILGARTAADAAFGEPMTLRGWGPVIGWSIAWLGIIFAAVVGLVMLFPGLIE